MTEEESDFGGSTGDVDQTTDQERVSFLSRVTTSYFE